MAERRFPIQTRFPRGASIPWSLAEQLYEACGQIWHGRQGQSLERLAERGGWGTGELGTMLLGLDVMGRERAMPSLLDALSSPAQPIPEECGNTSEGPRIEADAQTLGDIRFPVGEITLLVQFPNGESPFESEEQAVRLLGKAAIDALRGVS
jgi:hypothetical protein